MNMHGVCEQLSALDVEVDGQNDNIEEDRFGRFDDCREATNHIVAEELPAYDNTISAGDDTVLAVNENGDVFSQFESHVENNFSGHIEGLADKESIDSRPSQPVETNSTVDEFDTGFGDFTSFEEEAMPDAQGNLEAIICRELGHEFSGLVECWKAIVSSVERDLQKGIKLMDRLESEISATDRAGIIKSKKLREYIFGLAECVRLVRLITASIGELLCVAENIELCESTLSHWNDEVIIADAIVIDFLWSKISSAIGIASKVPHLESVVEIRKQSNFNVTRKADVCQLTLRSLAGGSGANTPVTWNDKKYLACAANYCANRTPDLLERFNL